MIELTRLHSSDIGREVVYASNRDREPGLLAGWCERFVYVQFEARNWSNYPSYGNYILAAIYPEHLAFVRRTRTKAEGQK